MIERCGRWWRPARRARVPAHDRTRGARLLREVGRRLLVEACGDGLLELLEVCGGGELELGGARLALCAARLVAWLGRRAERSAADPGRGRRVPPRARFGRCSAVASSRTFRGSFAVEAMTLARIRGDQFSGSSYFPFVNVDVRRAGRADGAGRNVFVLGVADGASGSVDPCANRPASCRARGARARARLSGWMGGRLPQTDAGKNGRELDGARSRRGKSGRPRYSTNMAAFSELFGRSGLHGTGAGVGREHGSGAMRGVRGARSRRPLSNRTTRIACGCSRRLGGHRSHPVTSAGQQAISTRAAHAGLRRKESDAGSKQPE